MQYGKFILLCMSFCRTMNLKDLGKKNKTHSHTNDSGVNINFATGPNTPVASPGEKEVTRIKFKKRYIVYFLLICFLAVGTTLYFIKLHQLNQTGLNFSPLDPIKTVISAVSAPKEDSIKKLAQTEGRTNFLLIGIDARAQSGSLLTDSMMLLSYDQEKNEFAQISFPRDLETHYKGSIYKLNSVFPLTYSEVKAKTGDKAKAYDEAFDNLSTSIQEISGLKVHYGMMVNFNAFKQIVNIVGGVEVDVERSFTDYQYPCDNDRCVMTISFKAGKQTMNGDKALQYSRSRHSLDNGEGSDFSRARRQQRVMDAIKNKFIQSDLISKADTLNQMIASLGENIRFFHMSATEINNLIESRELLQKVQNYAMVLDFNFGSFTKQLLSDSHRSTYATTGYILYPLLGKYTDVQALLQLYVHDSFLLKEDSKVKLVYTNSKRNNDYIKVKNIFFEKGLKLEFKDQLIKVTAPTSTISVTSTITPTVKLSPIPTVNELGSQAISVTVYKLPNEKNVNKDQSFEYYKKLLTENGITVKEGVLTTLPKELDTQKKDVDVLVVVE
jgi:LCP family protein required for cell wall assembly